MNERVVVLDYGSQYNQLIVRRVREIGIYAELWPHTTRPQDLADNPPRAVILSGGPQSVYADGAPDIDAGWLLGEVPLLGICYGMQILAHRLGGQVQPSPAREYGPATVRVLAQSPLFEGLPERLRVWMSHGDSITAPPPGYAQLATSDGAPVAAMGNGRNFGVQFHPEVVHSEHGTDVLRHFLFDVCGLRATWSMKTFLEQATAQIRARVGSERALVALSGGVDSSVAAALVHRAIGDRLIAVFVDHGLLRAGEAEQVVRTFAGHFEMQLKHIDASRRFLERLAGVDDPERKRKRIGEEFIRVFEQEAAGLGAVRYLVQGTLYPDVIESGGGAADVIKSHHNVGGLPEDMQFELLEPLRDLFKDEVRALGRELGLPEAIVARQPFPGPGLAIRMLGAVEPHRLEMLRQADRIVQEEVHKAGAIQDLWQWFAVLPGIRSVGVMGDHRTYAEAVVVRAVTSTDGMTADWARLPEEILERLASRIVNEVDGVNRVLYDITSKPPGTIEWE